MGVGWATVACDRLSALDASFLAVESPSAPMHVGWVAVFDAPESGSGASFPELFEHIAGQLGRQPRYRQRLVGVPFGVHESVWVDDADFDVASHVHRADGADLPELVDSILSSPLARDRPLWEMWVAEGLPGGGLAIIGKMHHCMVDGVAAIELGGLLLDSDSDASREPSQAEGADAPPTGTPSAGARLARGLVDRAADSAALALAPVRLVSSPSRMRGLPGAVGRGARTLAHTLLPPAPGSPLNQPGSAERHHVRLARPLDELREVKRRFGVTPNDVVLAVCAGALRRFAERRGETPQPLKAMVPVDVRAYTDSPDSGNRISFLFIELPCDEPDPVVRLETINRATAQRQRDGEAEELDAALGAAALTPTPLQRTLARLFAHPRLFNLTVSNVAGPALPRYLRGWPLRELYSAVPLANRHALSIGVVTVAGRICFAVYADAVTLPDADALRADLDSAFDELLAA